MVFSRDARLDALSLTNPAKRRFWLIFFDVFYEIK